MIPIAILILAAWLFLPVSGQATEFEKRFSIMDSHAKTLVDCTDERLSSCKVDGLEEKLACHQRMQEAMRLMNTVYYNTPMIDLPKTDLTRRLNAEWKSTMKDCVQ